MKNFKLKNKLISIFGIVIMLGAFFASIFSGFFAKNLQNGEEYTFATSSDYTADTNRVMDEIAAANLSTLEDSYSLRNEYPVLAEHQDKSLLCWAYAASKVLETTLIVNTGEYYNFSEAAIAYFAYLNGASSTINSDGTFQKFDSIIRKSGLVSETDFSNDIYYQMNETNAEHYSDVLKYADKNIAKQVVPIGLSQNSKFTNLSNEDKHSLIKYYIKNYGALSMALPGQGTFYLDQEIGYAFTEETNKNSGSVLTENHAVCLIGWNEYGFIALNSWGVDSKTSYEEIVITYDTMKKFYLKQILFGVDKNGNGGTKSNSWLFGYDYVGNSNVTLQTTSADEFSNTIVINSSNPVKNMFCYTEEISLTYKVSGSVNFESVYVDVFKGTENVTGLFNIGYNDDEQLVTISYTPPRESFITSSNLSFAGGNYVIHIYEDVNLLSSRNAFVYTGTEVSYFKFSHTTDTSKPIDYSMMNNYMSSANAPTFYAYSETTYRLQFYLTDINKVSSLTVNVSCEYYDEQTGTFALASALTGVAYRSDMLKVFMIDIPLDNEYAGKLVKIRFNVKSTLYNNCYKSFYINIFASTQSNVSTPENTYNILYNLDGGRNSEKNVSVYPQYIHDTVMTPVKFFEPTKSGYEFLGWYLDEDFKTPVTSISLADGTSGFLVLYAKWRYSDTSYFTASLGVLNVMDNNGQTKTLTGDVSKRVTVTYGDTVSIQALFNVSEELKKKSFSFRYYYYVNGEMKSMVNLIEDSDEITVLSQYEKIFGGEGDSVFAYPNLSAGDYDIEVVSVVVVSHEFSITSSMTYEVEVQKKEITLTYDAEVSKSNIYSGLSYLPKISYTGYYQADAAEFETVRFKNNEGAKTQAGNYEFEVENITNNNYFLNEEDLSQKYLLVIKPKALEIVWSGLSVVYNGRKQIPSCDRIDGLIGNDNAYIVFDSDGYVDAGTYKFTVQATTNNNYVVVSKKEVTLEIKKAPIKIIFDNVEERAQKSVSRRTPISFKVEGTYYDSLDSLQIEGQSAGLIETKSGRYTIDIKGGEYVHKNYEAEVVQGIYELTGYYYVYYTLPDGEVYREKVNYGETPVGITDEIFKKPFLGKLEYSSELVETGEDIYIVVSEENNIFTYVIIAGVVLSVIIYWGITRKARKNKVR